MNTESEAKASETLEMLVDKHSLSNVLALLESICHEKAEHVRTNWQDESLAKAWERAAKTLDSARAKVDI